MTLHERLGAIVAALPSPASSVTLSRADLEALLEGEVAAAASTARDLTVEDVAAEVGRAPSTVRGWLGSGTLRGYHLNGRDWRVPRAALRAYLDAQAAATTQPAPEGPTPAPIDLGAWRKVQGT